MCFQCLPRTHFHDVQNTKIWGMFRGIQCISSVLFVSRRKAPFLTSKKHFGSSRYFLLRSLQDFGTRYRLPVLQNVMGADSHVRSRTLVVLDVNTHRAFGSHNSRIPLTEDTYFDWNQRINVSNHCSNHTRTVNTGGVRFSLVEQGRLLINPSALF